MRFLLSTLIDSGIVMITLNPFAAAYDAMPIPVLPDVGSMIVAPSLSLPDATASSMIALAILSLTEPAGLKYSSFAYTFASRPYAFSKLFTFTSGVLPMVSATD